MPSILNIFLTSCTILAQLSSATPVRGESHKQTHSTSSKHVASATSSASTTSPTAAVSGATSTTSSSIWKPSSGLSWQIELSGTVSDFTYAADVFDIDLFDNTAAAISTLHANGKKVICYFSAGSYEDWRSDASSFTASDKGSPLDGWPGEWWLNTNSANVRSIMAARIQLAASKGCDAVDPDNVDGYNNANGIDLTQADAIDYMNFLAITAHAANVAIGLKNALEIVPNLVSSVEFAVNEQCIQYSECSDLNAFITANKPVFHIEYVDSTASVSASEKTADCAAPTGFSSILKDTDLDAWIEVCQPVELS